MARMWRCRSSLAENFIVLNISARHPRTLTRSSSSENFNHASLWYVLNGSLICDFQVLVKKFKKLKKIIFFFWDGEIWYFHLSQSLCLNDNVLSSYNARIRCFYLFVVCSWLLKKSLAVPLTRKCCSVAKLNIKTFVWGGGVKTHTYTHAHTHTRTHTHAHTRTHSHTHTHTHAHTHTRAHTHTHTHTHTQPVKALLFEQTPRYSALSCFIVISINSLANENAVKWRVQLLPTHHIPVGGK